MWSNICKPYYLERLNQIVNEKQAVVVSTTYCPYCTKAKKLLDQNNIEYREIMLDEINEND